MTNNKHRLVPTTCPTTCPAEALAKEEASPDDRTMATCLAKSEAASMLR